MKATTRQALPFKLRLKAWWQGYDSAEVAARLHASQTGKEPEPVSKPVVKKPETAPVNLDDPELPFDPWDSNRVEIAQYIWGEGYCGPGGPDHIIDMCKLLALSPEMSLLEIGANLGGPARTLADKYGSWVTGYETSARLVELANEKSHMTGLGKKAIVKHYDTETIDDFERNFDRALAKETLYTIRDKARLLALVEHHLKPGGLFLITDFVLGSESVPGKESYREWLESESAKRRPYMVTSQDFAQLLKNARFNIRVNEDVSASYINIVNNAWKGADKVAAQLAHQDDGETLLQALLAEAEFWSRRARMLESGDLRVWRFLAGKKGDRPVMMSDW